MNSTSTKLQNPEPGGIGTVQTEPAVSVVIPSYNSASFLPRAINSVLAQSWTGLEIIVVDDGSNDNTGQVVGGFDDERVRYHVQPHSGLPACARNTGIALARAPMVAFLDADDLWYPNKLEKTIGILHANPDIGLVCHAEHLTKDDGIVGTNIYGPAHSQMFQRLLFEGNALSTSATVVRVDVLRSLGGFDERAEYYCVEDYDLWLRIARSGEKFHFTPEVLGQYCLHDSNFSGISGENTERFYESFRSVIWANFATVENPTLPQLWTHWKNVGKSHYQCGLRFRNDGKYRQAWVEYLHGAMACFRGAAIFLCAVLSNQIEALRGIFR